jgi:predicted nucleic acid-binding Zn ribbon protein
VSAVPAPAEPLLACGNCGAPMQRLVLAGHYGRSVDIDLCRACDLVWFDGTETATLSGPALLDLIAAMASARALPHEMLRDTARCPRCAGALALVHNQSRWGRSTQLQCIRRDGAYQSFAQFLEEKGLLRPMSLVDRARLLRDCGRIECVNCGGAIGKDDAVCPWCRSIPSLLDIARLAHALDPLDTIEPPALYREDAQQGALHCAACGAALPEGESMRCPQCGATLAITSLAEANAQVQALAPALRAAAAHPSPEVVKRRLDSLDADLPRQRQWAADMQADADAQRGRSAGGGDEDFEWNSLLGRGTNPVRAVLIALVLWFGWHYWRR